MAKSVRIRDIADISGFSAGAVSRALKGQPGIGVKPREHIIQVAQKLGYDFSRLQTDKIQRVLFILHQQHNITMSLFFYTSLLMDVEESCREHNIALSFLVLGPGDDVEKKIRQHNPNALLIVGYLEPEMLLALRQLCLPVALVDLVSQGMNSVNPDNFRGGYLATRHLIDIGRKRIAFLVSSLSHYSIQQREKGYRQALFDAGILMPPDYEAIAPFCMDVGEALDVASSTLLELTEPPDALFAYNDVAAMIAMRACKNKGLRIPEDIAVIGFDNIDSAALATPPLSTVGVERHKLGKIGLELLLSSDKDQHRTLDVSLIVRDSTVKSVKS